MTSRQRNYARAFLEWKGLALDSQTSESERKGMWVGDHVAQKCSHGFFTSLAVRGMEPLTGMTALPAKTFAATTAALRETQLLLYLDHN